MFRAPTEAETGPLLALAVSTGLFNEAEAESLLGGVLAAFHAGDLAPGHQVRLWEHSDGTPTGWAYFAPDPYSERVWNLWWIGVSAERQGLGLGTKMMSAVEAAVTAGGGRVLVVETSSLPSLAKTRRFYAERGYAECGRVPEFYAEGDDKVIFARRLPR